VRQVHRKEVDLALDPGDLRQSLTKIHLRMARIVLQRHEHLAMPQPSRQHVVLNDGDPATVAVLVAKPFKDPFRGMPLPSRPTFIAAKISSMIPVNGSSFGRPSSPSPCRFPTKAICCRIFTPAPPDYPAASLREFAPALTVVLSVDEKARSKPWTEASPACR
jgi:hypothetical protein